MCGVGFDCLVGNRYGEVGVVKYYILEYGGCSTGIHGIIIAENLFQLMKRFIIDTGNDRWMWEASRDSIEYKEIEFQISFLGEHW